MLQRVAIILVKILKTFYTYDFEYYKHIAYRTGEAGAYSIYTREEGYKFGTAYYTVNEIDFYYKPKTYAIYTRFDTETVDYAYNFNGRWYDQYYGYTQSNYFAERAPTAMLTAMVSVLGDYDEHREPAFANATEVLKVGSQYYTMADATLYVKYNNRY